MRARWCGLLLSGLLLAGCSQIGGLAPVSGNEVSSVRTASIDVLLDKGVAIKVAPVCAESSGAFRCEGTTVDGGAIVVTAPASTPLRMTITVAGAQVFEGSVEDVLTAALEGGS